MKFFSGLHSLLSSFWRRLGSVNSKMNQHTPERGPDESFEDYKKRRAMSNLYLKYRQRGIPFWRSELVGTYRKADMEPRLNK